MHIPKDKRKRLELTSLKGIFVGYSASPNAYIIYNQEELCNEVSQDVIFDENVA